MLIIVCIQPLICKHTAVHLFPIGDTRSCYDAQNQEAAAEIAVSPKEKSAAFSFIKYSLIIFHKFSLKSSKGPTRFTCRDGGRGASSVFN